MIVSTRFEFSAAHQVQDSRHDRERRLHGHNYVVRVGVGGEPDPVTGMVIHRAALRAGAERVLDRYDHRLLNNVLAATPTVEVVAESVWEDLGPLFPGPPLARLTLSEDGGDAATLTPRGTRAVVAGLFSAAHRTHIPTISDEANLALFGICNNPAGHGHNYTVRVSGGVPPEALAETVRESLREFDHRNLSADIPDLAGRNVTTEVIARLLWGRMQSAARLHHIRLYELPDFFAEYAGAGDSASLGRRYTFFAAHRLANPRLSTAENEAVYGKCNRPDPHGHSYRVEVTVGGRIDEATGLAMNLADLDGPATATIGALDGRYLDADVAAFQDTPSTGEHIVSHLWRELEARFGDALARVRLWETRDNCFEIER